MKKIMLIGFLWLLSQAIQAQPPNFRERMQQRKVEIEKAKYELITTRINLKPEQEKQFWEVYDKYIEERLTLRKKITKTRRNGLSIAATDAELEKIFDDLLAMRQKEVDMDKNYKTILLKVINIRQFSELYRSEQDFLKRILEILRDKKPYPPKKDGDED